MESLLAKSIQITESAEMKPEIFKRDFQNRFPVVLKGAVLQWKPCKIWNIDYLKYALNSSLHSVQVMFSMDNQHFIDHNDFTTKRNMKPEELVDYIFQPVERVHDEIFTKPDEKITGCCHANTKKKAYLRTSSMPDLLYKDIFESDHVQSLKDKLLHESDTQDERSLSEDFSRKLFKQETMQLWIGTKGNVTQLHYDRNHGLLAQIIGRKRIFLFSHKDTGCLYPYPSYTPKSHVSKVNLRQPDDVLNRFPKFKRAEAYHCVINVGDLLYIPPFWWHDVTSVDNCVSVTLPWDISSDEEIPPCMLR